MSTPDEKRAFWRGFRKGYIRANIIGLPLYFGFILWWVLR